MIRQATGVLGVLMTVGIAGEALYVLFTMTMTGYRAPSAMSVILFLVVLLVFGTGFSLWHEDTFTTYW